MKAANAAARATNFLFILFSLRGLEPARFYRMVFEGCNVGEWWRCKMARYTQSRRITIDALHFLKLVWLAGRPRRATRRQSPFRRESAKIVDSAGRFNLLNAKAIFSSNLLLPAVIHNLLRNIAV
jgi:hypothetical protein